MKGGILLKLNRNSVIDDRAYWNRGYKPKWCTIDCTSLVYADARATQGKSGLLGRKSTTLDLTNAVALRQSRCANAPASAFDLTIRENKKAVGRTYTFAVPEEEGSAPAEA